MLVLAWTGLAFLLAFVVESMVEYLFGQLLDNVPKLKPLQWLLVYVPLAPGIGLAFFYRIDLVWLMGQQVQATMAVELPIQISWVGMLLSGLAIGRGSNYVHDLASKFVIHNNVGESAKQ
jgi:hypothetical protein